MQATLPPPTTREQKPYSLDEQDESVRIAVRALGAMRNSNSLSRSVKTSSQPTPALSTASSATSTSLPSPLLSPADEQPQLLADPDFVSRVSHFPLVGSALRAYEHTKASSRVVKYGAEMMESSVKTISRPVIDRLPVDVGQLDEFACRQLDRIERYHRPSPSPVGTQVDIQRASRERSILREDSEWERGRAMGREGWSSGVEARDVSVSMTSASRSRSRSRGVEHGAQKGEHRDEDGADAAADAGEQQVAQRSRWQAVLMEAGGISAALSEESMRRLKYCLQWLQYATAHIDAQILILRDFIASLTVPLSSSNPNSSASPHSHTHSPPRPHPNTPISPAHLRTLASARRDVVSTIRQVVDVVSKYAGGALPEPARSRVRGFILLLPQRWAVRAGEVGVVEGIGGGASSGVSLGAARARAKGRHVRGAGSVEEADVGPAAAPRRRDRERERDLQAHAGTSVGMGAGAGTTTVGGAAQAAQRILTLSTESLDMMRGVTAVVKESLEKADVWVERLRIVGVQRQQQHELQDTRDMPPPGPPAFSPDPSPVSSPVAHSPGPPSPWPMDAPSPSPSMYGMGGLTINGDGAEEGGSTPKGGKRTLEGDEDEEGAKKGMDVDA